LKHFFPPEHLTLRRLHSLQAWDLRLGNDGGVEIFGTSLEDVSAIPYLNLGRKKNTIN
jgi:hypothetical protein